MKDCIATRVYVSAFPDFRQFKRHVDKIAWETEVWIAEIPDASDRISTGTSFLVRSASLGETQRCRGHLTRQKAYVTQVGQELVSAFQLAGFATTPGQIGSAREVPVRKKLIQLLPRGVGVGAGCVIDSYGNSSRQMDVVLFEREICPVFAINKDPASTYYPCEGPVIAVGEVKTAINSSELEDIFRKIRLRQGTPAICTSLTWWYARHRRLRCLPKVWLPTQRSDPEAWRLQSGYPSERTRYTALRWAVASNSLSKHPAVRISPVLASPLATPFRPNLLVTLDGECSVPSFHFA